MIAWIRYVCGAGGGVNLDYCKDCPNKPDEFTPCQACPAPQVLPENIRAVNMYGRVHTLWQYDNRNLLRGLDYAGLAALFELLGVARHQRRRLFEQLQVIESAVLDIDKERISHGNPH